MHDRGVEAGLSALVQEHAVQHVADRGLEAEAHVRQPEDRRRAGQLGLGPADRLDGLDAVAAQVVLAGAEREGEHVEEEVGGLDAVALGRRGRRCACRPAASSRRSRAWPSSSMARQITAAPYSRASDDSTRSKRLPGSSPSSRLAELRMALPPEWRSPASSTCGSVESNTSGSAAWVAKRLRDLVHVGGAVAARRSRRTRRARARPPSPGRVPICTQVSQSPASIASRNFFEPLALVRSPTARYASSWWTGTWL